MRIRKQPGNSSSHMKDFAVHPKVFFFVDKKSGVRRFEVKAAPDGRLPVERAVDMLAVHCLMRRQSPSDFVVTVGASENLFESLGSRARKIIQDCRFVVSPVQLSHRQEEVLRAILQGLTNKEIATRLQVSESTIKFHVSLLLQKFEVTNRWELTRKATDFLSAQGTTGNNFPVPASAPQHSPGPSTLLPTRSPVRVDSIRAETSAGLPRRPGIRNLA
jgi:DNA-binding CsgD family transcriptional regulator